MMEHRQILYQSDARGKMRASKTEKCRKEIYQISKFILKNNYFHIAVDLPLQKVLLVVHPCEPGGKCNSAIDSIWCSDSILNCTHKYQNIRGKTQSHNYF